MLDRSCRNLIRYYRACYQADNRDLTLFNVFNRDCEHTRFIQGRELLVTGELLQHPLPRSYGERLYQSQLLFKREKTLLYGSFFLLGKLPSSHPGKRSVCAPLLYYHAQVHLENNEYSLTIDKTKPIVNWPLLRWTLNDASQTKEPAFIGQSITERDVAKVSHWLSALSKSINCLELYHYPRLATQAQIEAKQSQVKTDQFSLIAASAITCVNYSLASTGILSDLKAMAVTSYMPRSVNEFLLGEKAASQVDDYQPASTSLEKNAYKPKILAPSMPGNLPTLLSKAQRQALHNAARHTVSQIIGPPGTGKSDTIASLALDRYLQGESVLVVGPNNDSIRLINSKLAGLLGKHHDVVRLDHASYQKKLRRMIKDLLASQPSADHQGAPSAESLLTQQRKLHQLEQRFYKKCNRATRYGNATWKVRQYNYWLTRLNAWWTKRLALKQDNLFELLAQLIQQQRIRHLALDHHISDNRRQRLATLLAQSRHRLQRFCSANSTKNTAEQTTHFADVDYAILLQAMPIWLGTLGDLHRNLPLKAELFDLVIIDEANQCDIASVLPAIYRAKHVVIVGDDKQLKFVSFLAKDRQDKLQVRYDLEGQGTEFDYRHVSALDLTSRRINHRPGVVLLDEHFRSKNALIEFSNRKFYQRKLKIIRYKPGHQDDYPIDIIQCQGVYKNGKNQREAIAVLEFLRNKVHSQAAMRVASSIGILSPFREQTIFISKLLAKYLSQEQIQRHKVKIETTYGFQGEERDIMLLSLCVDESSADEYRYMNREDVFNVAITRARDEQYLFMSVRPHKLPSQSLLFEYVHSIARNQSYCLDEVSDFDAFQAEVSRLLTLNGVNTWKNYPIAGGEFDLVCQYGERTLAIDLIGYPGETQDYYLENRYRILQRAGFSLYPLTYTRWTYQRHKVLKQLMSLLQASDTALTSQEACIF